MLQLTTLVQENSLESQQGKLINRLKKFASQQNFSELESNNRINWILRFIQFHNKQHPLDLNQSDIEAFLSTLATKHNYDATIQINAANALIFLYQDFLQIDLSELQYIKIKTRRGFIDRFGLQHCSGVLNQLQGTSLLMAELAFYGKLKLREVVDLKLADINIKKNEIQVRKRTGEIKFVLNIPIRLILDLRIQTMRVRQLVHMRSKQFSTINKETTRLSQTKQSEDLFPIANSENPDISSRLMQLTLLKNDIKIATRQYLRFSPTHASSKKHGIRLSNNPKNIRGINDLKESTLEILRLKKINLSIDNAQITFNFKTPLDASLKLPEKIKLGAA